MKYKNNFITKRTEINEKYSSGASRSSTKNKGKFNLIPPGPLLRLAQLYERGSLIYGAHNWEKGFNFSRALDSMLRHINQFKDGQKDEDHLIAAVWNLFAIVHFEEMIERGLLPKELNDLPNYQPKEIELKEEDIEEELTERPEDGGVDYNNSRLPPDKKFYYDNGVMPQNYWSKK